MNTEKIEKLKKSLSNSKIPADLKPKIEAEIKRLESLDAIATEKAKEEKEEEKEEAKPVAKTRKPRAKRTSTRKPSETSKPKRTAMSLAKEIRKEGESWKDAQARASKMMKEGSKEITKTVETELDKLTKLVKSKKELRSQVGRTNLLIDAKRKAKPMGRRISKDGNVYYENRANRTDRGTYGKYHLADGGGVGMKYIVEGDKVLNTHTNMYVDYDFGTKQNAEDFANHRNRMFKKFGKDFAEGGYLTDPTFGTFQNQVYAGGGGVKPTLKKGDNVVVIGKRWFDRANGNTYHTAMVLVNGQSLGKSKMTYGYEEAYLQTAKEILLEHYNLPKGMKETSPLWQLREYGVTLTKTVSDGLKRDLATGGSVTNERKHVNKDEDYEVRYAKPRPSRKGYKGVRGFELGGTVLTDLAGHTDGGTGGLNAGMPLDGYSDTGYTGLVGETGAMSSSEMFMNGGGLPSGVEQSYMITQSGGNPAQHYARGGGVRRVGNREYSLGRNWTNDHRHVNKGEDHEVKYTRKGKFLGMFNDGGSVTNERKHVNKKEDYEVRYAKPRPSRKGYKGKRSFSRGGLLGQSAKVKFLSEEFASSDLIDQLKSKLKIEKNNVEDKDVIAFAYTDYGGDILDKYAIEYFLENHPNNIVVEPTSYYGKNAFVFGKPAKEWMKETEDYPLGFEDFESYFYEKENEDFEEGINYFIKDLERDYSFNEDEVRDALLEQFSGYFSVGTSGLDYSEDVMIKYLKENDLIKEEYNRGGSITNERRYVNKGEDYEVRYAKPRPSRKGYKGARKFMAGGSFANGGGVENKYNSMSKEDKEELMREKIGIGRTPFSEYEKYNQLSNYHKEEVNKHFNSKKFMAGGMNKETPRIYVADLEAYNNGRLEGEWLDLADYNDADELMDAIQDVLKKSGGEEYAIHDVENIPSSMYSEYMGKRDFEELYEMMDLADRNDLPLSVVTTVVSEYGSGAVDEFYGKYDSADDFAQQMVDDLGIESFIDFERYLIISETDRRLLAQEMADSYVDDIRNEDGGNRLIEEAGMDVSEYEEADSETQEEMLDKAREVVYDEYYDTWYDGLNDPYYFLVEEQGMYDAESFANANFVQVDYEALAEALEYDYAFVYSDGDLYVFNIR